MSIVADPVEDASVNEVSVTLRAGQDGFEHFVNEVFADMEAMCRTLDEQREWFEARCQKLEEEKQRLANSLAERQSTGDLTDPSLPTKIAELEQDRQALEQELEEVRTRAADLGKTIGEQKRQMADERAQWTAELRQLRRILDKQASWIAQQSRQPAAFATGLAEPGVALPADSMPPMPGQAVVANTNGYPTPPPPAVNRDPVLGSVLSQFELLRKDLERRRAPPRPGDKKNVNAP